MNLSRGDDSRTAGAPADSFPGYEDAVRERYDILIAAGEVPELAMTKARADVDAMMARHADWLKSRADYSTLAGEHRRGQRAAAQGVNPDDLPADEFGNVSPRTVRDANLPIDEQQAQLDQYQGLTDAEIRALRGGRFHGTEASERRYDQEQGFGTGLSKTGKSDLDYFRQQQQHQGSIRTGRGEMIPMGPEPTPENIQSMREFDEAVNENPGSEFQAQYDPASYEEYREGVREGYRADAQADVKKFGTGPTAGMVRADLGLDPLTDDQAEDRARRARSESRVRTAQRGRFYEQKLQNESGMPAGTDIAAMEAERFRRRDADRTAEKDRRRNLVAQRGELRGAGLAPAVGDFRNRTDDLIDRLGQGGMNDWQRTALLGNAVAGTEIANPSPLGVEAVGQQNAMRILQNRAYNPDGQTDPNAAIVAAGLESQLTVEEWADRERDREEGVLSGNSGAGRAMLDTLATRFGYRFGTPAPRVREMIDAAVAQGIPEQDALAYAREKGFVDPSPRPAAAPAPAGAPAPAPAGRPFSAPGARGGRRR
jgi:hypothetical protein